MRRSTSRNRSTGSSTTGTRTLVVVSYGSRHGSYRRDKTTLTTQRAHTMAEKTANRYSGPPSTTAWRTCNRNTNISRLPERARQLHTRMHWRLTFGHERTTCATSGRRDLRRRRRAADPSGRLGATARARDPELAARRLPQPNGTDESGSGAHRRQRRGSQHSRAQRERTRTRFHACAFGVWIARLEPRARNGPASPPSTPPGVARDPDP